MCTAHAYTSSHHQQKIPSQSAIAHENHELNDFPLGISCSEFAASSSTFANKALTASTKHFFNFVWYTFLHPSYQTIHVSSQSQKVKKKKMSVLNSKHSLTICCSTSLGQETVVSHQRRLILGDLICQTSDSHLCRYPDILTSTVSNIKGFKHVVFI